MSSIEYSVNWTTHNVPVFLKHLARFAGQPDVHGLEIGVWEGRTTRWLFENILTHPTSALLGIDGFEGLYGLRELDHPADRIETRFWRNLKGYHDRLDFIASPTPQAYKDLLWCEAILPFDFAYIDGCHRADVVLSDLVHVSERMAPEGVIILDDYIWEDSPPELRGHVARAVAAFMECNLGRWYWDPMGTCAVLTRHPNARSG